MKNLVKGVIGAAGLAMASTSAMASEWYEIGTLDTTPVTTIMTAVLAAGAIIWCCRKGYNALFKS